MKYAVLPFPKYDNDALLTFFPLLWRRLLTRSGSSGRLPSRWGVPGEWYLRVHLLGRHPRWQVEHLSQGSEQLTQEVTRAHAAPEVVDGVGVVAIHLGVGGVGQGGRQGHEDTVHLETR